MITQQGELDEGLKKRASSKGVSRKFNQDWGGNILEEFFFSSRDGSSFSSAINPNPPKRQKDEIENEPDDFKT